MDGRHQYLLQIKAFLEQLWGSANQSPGKMHEWSVQQSYSYLLAQTRQGEHNPTCLSVATRVKRVIESCDFTTASRILRVTNVCQTAQARLFLPPHPFEVSSKVFVFTGEFFFMIMMYVRGVSLQSNLGTLLTGVTSAFTGCTLGHFINYTMNDSDVNMIFFFL